MNWRRIGLHAVAYLALNSLLHAAEPVILFEDTFDGQLGDGWSWLREDSDHWRIRDNALEIRVEPGKANSVKNALVRRAPDRSASKYAVELTVSFVSEPTTQYEQAGMTWYHRGQPTFKLVHEHIDGEDWMIPGRKPAAGRTVHLRLIVDGNQWTAQFCQDDATEFETIGAGELPPPDADQISLQCYDGPPDAEHWMRFDDFRIVQLPN